MWPKRGLWKHSGPHLIHLKMLFTPFFKPSLHCSCWAKRVAAHLVCMRSTAHRGCKLPLYRSRRFKRPELCSWLHIETSLQLLQFHFMISASDLLFNLDNHPHQWCVLICLWETNRGSLSSVIRSPPQRVVRTPRAASAAERKERCRRSENSCRAPPRCLALKVSVSVCDSVLWEMCNSYLVPDGW